MLARARDSVATGMFDAALQDYETLLSIATSRRDTYSEKEEPRTRDSLKLIIDHANEKIMQIRDALRHQRDVSTRDNSCAAGVAVAEDVNNDRSGVASTTTEPQVAEASKEEQKLAEAVSDMLVTERPTETMDDIVGLSRAKEVLKTTVLMPIQLPRFYKQQNINPFKGVLLFGPPGTGKTMIAKALANAAKAQFFLVTSNHIVSKWQGESEKNLAALFQQARVGAPSVIFVDEIDAFCVSRSAENSGTEASRRLLTQFLIQLGGFVDDSSNRVLFLGATNTPWDLDDAMMRRFQQRIYIPLPDAEHRELMIRRCMKSLGFVLSDEVIAEIVVHTDGFSSADIQTAAQDITQEVSRLLLGEYFIRDPDTNKLIPTQQDTPGAFHQAIETITDDDLSEQPVTPDPATARRIFLASTKSVSDTNLCRFTEFARVHGINIS